VGLRWDMWLAAALVGMAAAVLLAAAVTRMSSGHGAWWKAALFYITAMVLCLGGTTLSFSMFSNTDELLRTLKNPAPPTHLDANWGRELAPEKRTEYSTTLARITFSHWGMKVRYFDITGNLRTYEPTEADREDHRLYRTALAHAENTRELLLWATVGWLFVPWVGVGIAFMPIARRRLNRVS
jgi:hypothetical protein